MREAHGTIGEGASEKANVPELDTWEDKRDFSIRISIYERKSGRFKVTVNRSIHRVKKFSTE